MNPRANRRERTFQGMPSRMELKLRPVVVVGRPHGTDEAEVVGHGAQVRPPVAHLQPALAKLPIAHLQRIELRMHLVQTGDHLAQVLLEIGRLEHVAIGRFVVGLVRVLVERRLRVEALHLAHAADEKNPDDALRLGRSAGKRGEPLRPQNPVLRKQRPQSQSRKTHPHIGQKRPARAGWKPVGQAIQGDFGQHVRSRHLDLVGSCELV